MKNTKLAGVLISSFIFILACGVEGTAIPNTSPTPELSIHITGTSVVEITSDSISQPNCNGTAEVENQIEKSRSIAHTLETSGEFTVNANGQIGFAGTDVELGATVAAKLGTTYGLTETIAKSLTVKARPGTNMTHTIKQSEIWKVGTAKIAVGNQEATIPFQFREDFTIELVSSEDQGCGSQNPAPSATIEVPISPTFTVEPSMIPTIDTRPTDTPPGTVLQIGETWTTNGFSVQLRSLTFAFGDEADLDFVITNNTGRTLFFHFSNDTNVVMKDDLGRIYNWATPYEYDLIIENGSYDNLRLYKGGNFSGIQYLMIIIDLLNLIFAQWNN